MNDNEPLSPAQARPAAGAPLIQAVRGPILLLTLGGLFSIDQLGSVPFSRTWPSLLIVVGLLKLLEGGGNRQDHQR